MLIRTLYSLPSPIKSREEPKYLSNYQNAYGTIKPIGMAEPISLGKIYTEVQFSTRNIREYFTDAQLEASSMRKLPSARNDRRMKTIDGIEAANNYQGLMVLGQPGCGKTTYLRRLGWECLRTHGILAKGHSGKAKYIHELLPVLVELRQCRSDETATITELLARELGNSGFPESVKLVEYLLDKGSLLVLLDALDEVAKDKVLTIVEQTRDLTRKYPNCRFVISCRSAFHRDFFPAFQDVTMLEFSDEQIHSFVNNWFSSNTQRQVDLAGRFIEKLFNPLNEATLELARSPVLLGYLCVAYQGTLALSTNRAQVYRRALDIYLQEWNAHGLKTQHSEQVHEYLPHDTELDMLGEIAYEAFKNEKFFLTQDEWTSGIRNFMSDLVDRPKALNAELILKKVAVSQGLVVQRTHLHWSFSHLTLQEYLTAWHIDRLGLTSNLVERHLFDLRWREVFLILAGMRPAGSQLELMIKCANEKICREDTVWSMWCAFLTKWDPKNSSDISISSFYAYKFIGLSIGLTIEAIGASDTHLDLQRAHELGYVAALSQHLARLLNYRANDTNNLALDIAILPNEKNLQDTESRKYENDVNNGMAVRSNEAEMSKIIAGTSTVGVGAVIAGDSAREASLSFDFDTGISDTLAITRELLEFAQLHSLENMRIDCLEFFDLVAHIQARREHPMEIPARLRMHRSHPKLLSPRKSGAWKTHLETLIFILKCRNASTSLKEKDWNAVLSKFL